MKKPCVDSRRRTVCLSGVGLVFGGGSLLMADQGANYMQQLRGSLGLDQAALKMRLRLTDHANLPDDFQAACTGAALRLERCIGDQWQTAAHTIPSLVDEDIRIGRSCEIGGLLFSMTELALLIG
jgi:hypothetical protein